MILHLSGLSLQIRQSALFSPPNLCQFRPAMLFQPPITVQMTGSSCKLHCFRYFHLCPENFFLHLSAMFSGNILVTGVFTSKVFLLITRRNHYIMSYHHFFINRFGVSTMYRHLESLCDFVIIFRQYVLKRPKCSAPRHSRWCLLIRALILSSIICRKFW